jgi:L-fuconolactonase
MIIDTHQHYWQLNRFNYSWISQGSKLAYHYLPADALPVMRAADVNDCVVVEAGANAPGELHWMLELAAEYPHIAGVVGWIDLMGDVESILSEIDPECLHDLKGVRINCFDPEADWRLLTAGLNTLAAHHLTCDLLVGAGMLPHLQTLIAMNPNVTFILDHFGGARITPGDHIAWKEAIRRIAALPNTVTKISGYLTASEPQPLTIDTLCAYVDTALELFGAKRLMVGSDWPVCLMGGAYADTVNLLKTAVSALSPDEQADIYANTAIQTYNLQLKEI